MDKGLNIYISLIITGDIDTQKINEIMKIKSDNLKNKKKDIWILSTENKLESDDINEHVNWILDKVEIYLPKIKEQYKIDKSELACYWYSKYGHGGPYFSKQILKRIVKNDLSLWIDTYYD